MRTRLLCESPPSQPLCADIDGFSLHAAVRCAADDRQALEQLCRYITRPALAHERVQTNAAGQVVPSRQGVLSLSTTCQAAMVCTRSLASAGRVM